MPSTWRLYVCAAIIGAGAFGLVIVGEPYAGFAWFMLAVAVVVHARFRRSWYELGYEMGRFDERHRRGGQQAGSETHHEGDLA